MVPVLDIAATRVTMLMASRRRNCESCPPYKRHMFLVYPAEPQERGRSALCRREVFINTHLNMAYVISYRKVFPYGEKARDMTARTYNAFRDALS